MKGLVMNYKKTLLFFTFATLVSVTLRTLIIFFTTDPSSGFFKQEFAVFSYGMIAIIIAAALLCIVFAIKCKRPKAPAFWERVKAIISVLLGICIAVEALFLDYSGNAAPWQNLMQTLLGVLAGVVFVWLGLSLMGLISSPAAFVAIPVVFYIFRLIVVFITYSGVATIADNAFELASVCACLVFMMQFAKSATGIGSEKPRFGFFPISICCALVIFTQAVPVIIAATSGNHSLIHSNSLFLPTSILMGLFCLCFSLFETTEEPEKKHLYRPRHESRSGISVHDLFLGNDDE